MIRTKSPVMAAREHGHADGLAGVTPKVPEDLLSRIAYERAYSEGVRMAQKSGADGAVS